MITATVVTILVFIIIAGLLSFAFSICGELIKAVLWLCIEVPISCVLFALGIACCCTIILIPVGLALFKCGGSLLIPN